MNTLSFLNRLIAIIFTVCYAYQILYIPIVWLFCKRELLPILFRFIVLRLLYVRETKLLL